MFWDCFTIMQPATELSQGFPRGAWCLLLRTELEWQRSLLSRPEREKSPEPLLPQPLATRQRCGNGWIWRELLFPQSVVTEFVTAAVTQLPDWEQAQEEVTQLYGYFCCSRGYCLVSGKRWFTKAVWRAGFWLPGSLLDHSARDSIYIQNCFVMKFRL